MPLLSRNAIQHDPSWAVGGTCSKVVIRTGAGLSLTARPRSDSRHCWPSLNIEGGLVLGSDEPLALAACGLMGPVPD